MSTRAVRGELGAVDQDLRAGGVGLLGQAVDGVDVAGDVAGAGDGHQRDTPGVLLPGSASKSASSRRAVGGQARCAGSRHAVRQGRSLEWCSMPLVRTTSRSAVKGKRCASLLIASVVFLPKMQVCVGGVGADEIAARHGEPVRRHGWRSGS